MTTYLDDFYGGTGDYTTAFSDAAAWSVTNRTPVYIKESSTAYVTSSPIPVGLNCKFIGTHQPAWSPDSSAGDAAVIIQPSSTFPTTTNRGLFEIDTDGRNASLQGLSLQGVGRGTNIHGIVLPGSSSAPELGLLLQDLEIENFSGDGIRGGARVAFLNRLMIHENAGYGVNINDPWYDCRSQYTFCFYNRQGGLNIDADAQLNTFFNCRFERSGQVYGDPQNALSSANWNTNAPGIRMRGGQRISFVQCDTDANTGPGLDVAVTSSSPAYRPYNCTFMACVFNRDSQGDAKTTNSTGAGIKLLGYANTGGQTVDYFRFVDVAVSAYYSNDTGTTAQINPARGVWIENTIFTQFDTGAQVDGNTTQFYFGSGTSDPVTNNWRAWFNMPQYGITMPAYPETPPFTTTGMVRENGKLQRWNGSAWVAQTPASGTATVTTAATSVAVTHGLGATPSVQNISVTPTNNLGNASKFWVSNPTSTQFTINVNAAPGATTATFAWQASL